jgi:hypothetical protein
MRKVVIACLLGLTASATAQGAVLSLRVVGDPAATALTLAMSETAAIEIVVDLEEFEEATAANIFFDTVQVAPAGDADGEAFEVLSVLRAGDPDFIWTGTREFRLAPMIDLEFEDLPPGAGISLDNTTEHNGYYLIANLAADDSLAGGTGTPHILDRIVICGIAPGTIEVTFEQTPRPPEVYRNNFGTELTLDLGLGDFGVDGPPVIQRDPQPLTITVTEADTGGDDTPPGGGDDPAPGGDPGPIDDDGTEPTDDDDGIEPADDNGGGQDDGPVDDGDDDVDPADDGVADDDPADDSDGPGDDADDGAVDDQPDDGDEPGDDPDEPVDDADDGDGGEDNTNDADDVPAADDGNGEVDADAPDDSETPDRPRPCGFGAIGGFLMSFFGLFALRPHWGRRRWAD